MYMKRLMDTNSIIIWSPFEPKTAEPNNTEWSLGQIEIPSEAYNTDTEHGNLPFQD